MDGEVSPFVHYVDADEAREKRVHVNRSQCQLEQCEQQDGSRDAEQQAAMHYSRVIWIVVMRPMHDIQ